MAVIVTIYPKTVTWNAESWDATDGGTLAVTYDHESRSEGSRSGDDEYPRTQFSVDKEMRASVRVQEVKQTHAIGTKSDLVYTLSTKSSTASVTLSDMVLEGVGGSQERAAIGDAEMRFVHESEDGKTVPIT